MMELNRRQIIAAGTSAAAALTLAGCGASATESRASDSDRTGSAAAGDRQHARPLTVAQTSAQAIATVASLKKLDDHPLFDLRWEGEPARITPPEAADTAALPTGYACTLFAASTPDGQALVARNFDWDPAPASVVTSSLSSGRASLAVTDLRYAGIEVEADLENSDKKQGLTRVHAIAFDGMNTEGLFIGLAADDRAEAEYREDREWVGGLSIQRMILDHADTVDDALEVFDTYNVDFAGGPGLHYLLADASGAQAVVEFDAGKLAVLRPPEGQPWMCLENFHMSSVAEADRGGYSRYSTCAATMGTAGGKVSVDEAVRLLDEVRQGHTQWQSVYRLGEGALRVVGEGPHEFAL